MAGVAHAGPVAVGEASRESGGRVVADKLAALAPDDEHWTTDSSGVFLKRVIAIDQLVEPLVREVAAVVPPSHAAIGKLAQVVEQALTQELRLALRVEGVRSLHERFDRVEFGRCQDEVGY